MEIFEVRLRRDPLGEATFDQHGDYELTEDQLQVLAELDMPLRAPRAMRLSCFMA